MKINKMLFGDWQARSIIPVVKFKVPGLYLLTAKTYGVKGLLGGTHSWLVHADDSRQTVIEVTNVETIGVQGSSRFYSLRQVEPASIQEQLVFVSDRNGGQKWFGGTPKAVYLGNIGLDRILDISRAYPRLNSSFNVLTVNCNTFTSWVLCNLGHHIWTGIGAKNWAKLAK